VPPVVARFFNFQRGADGKSVIYRGVGPDNSIVEIEQAVDDLGMMLILIASTLERSANLATEIDAAHRVEDVDVRPDGGEVIVTFRSPPGVSRHFRLTRGQAAQMSETLRRGGLGVVG
jgi:hypothetical protein